MEKGAACNTLSHASSAAEACHMFPPINSSTTLSVEWGAKAQPLENGGRGEPPVSVNRTPADYTSAKGKTIYPRCPISCAACLDTHVGTPNFILTRRYYRKHELLSPIISSISVDLYSNSARSQDDRPFSFGLRHLTFIGAKTLGRLRRGASVGENGLWSSLV